MENICTLEQAVEFSKELFYGEINKLFTSNRSMEHIPSYISNTLPEVMSCEWESKADIKVENNQISIFLTDENTMHIAACFPLHEHLVGFPLSKGWYSKPKIDEILIFPVQDLGFSFGQSPDNDRHLWFVIRRTQEREWRSIVLPPEILNTMIQNFKVTSIKENRFTANVTDGSKEVVCLLPPDKWGPSLDLNHVVLIDEPPVSRILGVWHSDWGRFTLVVDPENAPHERAIELWCVSSNRGKHTVEIEYTDRLFTGPVKVSDHSSSVRGIREDTSNCTYIF